MLLFTAFKKLLSSEKELQSANLKEDTSNAPHVHLVSVVAVCEQALWRPVPAGGDVLGIGLLRVDAPTAAKVRQLETLINDQDVFWLDVPVNKHHFAVCCNCKRGHSCKLAVGWPAQACALQWLGL